MSHLRAVITFVFLVSMGIATSVAESPNPKRKVLGEGRGSLHKHTHKLRGPLTASIEMSGAKPQNPGDVFSVRGVIASSQAIQKVNFQWSLPEGVEVVSGDLTGQMETLSPESPKSVDLLLKTLTGENHRIHFIVDGQENQASFADSAQYNTLIQEMINESKKELLKSTESYAEKNGKLKVLH